MANGVAPGYPSDILAAGDVIILDENVDPITRSAVIDYDGGDKIATTGNLAITRLAWASGSGTYLAGAVEIYPTVNWGRNFVLPVGEDYLVNEMFDYVGALQSPFVSLLHVKHDLISKWFWDPRTASIMVQHVWKGSSSFASLFDGPP